MQTMSTVYAETGTAARNAAVMGGAGATAAWTDDAAGRVLRDAGMLFAALRGLDTDTVEATLAEVRRMADELEVEMAGGEPDGDGRDAGRDYYARGVR
jgi:hypothetical protein